MKAMLFILQSLKNYFMKSSLLNLSCQSQGYALFSLSCYFMYASLLFFKNQDYADKHDFDCIHKKLKHV